MPTVTSRQLDQFLIDGGGLFVTRDCKGKVVDCRIAPDGVVYVGIFAVYEKAGLVVQSADSKYVISAIGRKRIEKAYSRDTRFTKRKRLTTDQAISHVPARSSGTG
jgi:hypothetical protein